MISISLPYCSILKLVFIEPCHAEVQLRMFARSRSADMEEPRLRRPNQNSGNKTMEVSVPMRSAAPANPALESTQPLAPGRLGLLRTRPQTILVVPVAGTIGLAIHFLGPRTGVAPTTHYYPVLLCIALALGLIAAVLQTFSSRLQNWMRRMCPILGMAVFTMAMWQLVTSCLGLLPMPYFPGPEGVMAALVSDRALLFDSTWHSLILLLSGYAIGTCLALITGVTIGWFPHARYWGMPLLKIVGPIPATAWI